MINLSGYKSIYVTGATGWLGRRVVDALTNAVEGISVEDKAPEIHCLLMPGEPSKALLDRGIKVHYGSLTERDTLTDFLKGAQGALVLHTAGLVHPHRWVADFDRVNFQGTMKLVEEAEKANATRVVIVSSNSPFGGNATRDGQFDEESPYNPYMGYGHSKWRMELALRDRIKDGKKPALTIVRPPWFYGPGQPPRQTLFFTMIKKGAFPLMGDGSNMRSMGYVDSLALGILLAAEKKEAAGQIYWLADERPYSMAEIIDTVRKTLAEDFSMKVKDSTVKVPALIADVARLADGTLQYCGIYHQKIHVLSEMNMTISCSIEKAKKELGYKPLVELREGMRRSIQWCLNNNMTI